jgi:choline monooxygenase
MINGLDSQYCAAVEKSKLGLRPMRVGLWNDLVFVNLFVDAPFREEHMAPLHARCAAYNFLEMRHTAKGKLLIENYGESYHLPCIHQSLNDRSPMDQHKHAFVSDRFGGGVLPPSHDYITQRFMQRVAESLAG